MQDEWLVHSADDLRRDAEKLRQLALHVCRRDLAYRLEEQAAILTAKSELQKVVQQQF